MSDVPDRDRRLVVAITGASGAPYAVRFLQEAVKYYGEIYVALSDQAMQVISLETGQMVNPRNLSAETLLGFPSDAIRFVDKKDYFSPPASGSFRHDGMVIVPCSMGTAARIAQGISDDLINRAADVCLKERRKLILVPRETPWNSDSPAEHDPTRGSGRDYPARRARLLLQAAKPRRHCGFYRGPHLTAIRH